MAKTPAEKVRDTEARKRASGLREIRVWVPDNAEAVAALREAAARLCADQQS